MKIKALFRDTTFMPKDFDRALRRIGNIILGLPDENHSTHWYAQGYTVEEALLYRAYVDGAPSKAILAVLTQEYKNKISDVASIGLWNSIENHDHGATVACHWGPITRHATFELDLGTAYIRSVESVIAIIQRIVNEFQPIYVTVYPWRYVEKKVFDDRPGVGWMLYLPKVLTVQQVPEAHALIPIPEAGKRQVGTLIVSEIDGVFSLDNPAHVLNANQIEIRLVDQDLLPLYAEI